MRLREEDRKGEVVIRLHNSSILTGLQYLMPKTIYPCIHSVFLLFFISLGDYDSDPFGSPLGGTAASTTPPPLELRMHTNLAISMYIYQQWAVVDCY